jgi:molybdopterin converting factor subunit 1
VRTKLSGLVGYNRGMPPVTHTVCVHVLFFGRLKEVAGVSEESVELPPGSDIETLFATCAALHPQLPQYRSSIVATRNQEFAAWHAALSNGDEVGFLPPVSGG